MTDNNVRAIAEDLAGNLWIGTNSGGVSRFDGVNWRTFTTQDGLANNDVHAITVDRSGKLWVGTYGGGVSRFDGATWTTFTTTDGLADNFVTAIMADHAGNIWVGTDGSLLTGLSRFDGTGWSTYSQAGTRITAITEDRSGNLWFGTEGGGVVRFDGVNWRTFSTADGLANDYVLSIAQDRSGNLWFGTFWAGGVSRFDGTTWTTFTTADGLGDNYAQSIMADRSGNLWFGGRGFGVSRFDGTHWKTFTEADGLAGGFVPAITEDQSGNIWFGTFGGGINRFDGSTWTTVRSTAGGLISPYVSAITEDRQANLWFGTQYGVSRFDGANWTTFTTPQVKAITEDSSGNLWFGTYGGGVSRFDGTNWRAFTTADGLASDYIVAIASDHSGNIWLGSPGSPNYGGVSRFDGTSWKTFTTADGLANNYVQAITTDRAGNVWFGTNGSGVSKFDGTSWGTFTTADGLVGNNVHAIAADSSGNLWFGADQAVSRFDGTHWKTFTTADGFPNHVVDAITVERSGTLWFGTNGDGVGRFDGSSYVTLTAADGLVDNYIYAMTEDHSGNLWFATSVAPTYYEPDRVPPRTIFLNTPPALSVSRNLSATFVAAYGEIRGTQFSTRLDGALWSPWASVGSWAMSEIPDGIHRLEARSRDKSGNVEVNPAAVIFEVDATPPAPIISSPTFGQPVRGTTVVRGTAADTRFRQYRLDVRAAGSKSWEPPGASVITESTTQVTDGLLTTWDTSGLPDGNYEMRLSVLDSLGLTGFAQISVIVDNHAPYADQTAPAKVPAASGGDIFTTNSELHLYFPPYAFEEDAVVAVAAASPSDTLPSGAVEVEPAYDVSWNPSTLRKPATLEFSTAGKTPAPGSLAIYVLSPGGSWQRLGGSAEAGKVSLAIQAPGRYALAAETAPAPGSGALSAISFTPRVFSVSNHFANDQVAIGFSLGRSAPVTVRVYNRAGRLVRDVVEGQVMGVGANLVRWNGTDRADVPVADGIYLVTVEALGETRKSTIAVVR